MNSLRVKYYRKISFCLKVYNSIAAVYIYCIPVMFKYFPSTSNYRQRDDFIPRILQVNIFITFNKLSEKLSNEPTLESKSIKILLGNISTFPNKRPKF